MNEENVRVESGNLLALPINLPARDEFLEALTQGPGFRLERIISTGRATPPGEWYDQEWDEWVALLQGRATLRCGEERLVRLEAGDWLLLPAHLRHRVEETSHDPPCVWLALHCRAA